MTEAATSSESPPRDQASAQLWSTIGKNITIFRRLRGLSILELADVANISERRLIDYENGARRIPALHLAVIAQHCTVDIRMMFRD